MLLLAFSFTIELQGCVYGSKNQHGDEKKSGNEIIQRANDLAEKRGMDLNNYEYPYIRLMDYVLPRKNEILDEINAYGKIITYPYDTGTLFQTIESGISKK